MKYAWSTEIDLAFGFIILNYGFLICEILLILYIKNFFHNLPDFNNSIILDNNQLIANLFSENTCKIPSALIERQINYDEKITVDTKGLIIDGTVRPKFSWNYCATCHHTRTKNVIKFASRLKTTFLHLKGVYLAGSCHISDGRRVFSRDPRDILPYKIFIPGETRSFAGNYDHAICVGHRWSSYYGHFITDYLCPLMCVPREYWAKSKVIVGLEPETKSLNHVFDLLTMIGIKNESIHILGRTEWVFCNNLYTVVDPPSYFSHPATCYVNLSKLLNKNLKLQDVEAKQYVICNRRPPANRKIANFDELWN
ncbi:hypothetical protein TVAG_144420 [Trichomonas vaginalis G3]|uniref:Glycosyltransferase 61 catalytic domain-containing protein n=1 Tax=Trichomonas vaginalis (strain ATCC PRA-98 / G3) TaxID=412133 RepID=A2FHD5_TRIV3|nr:glycosyltransferase family [Trichomonas vaginalis G3]EAX95693.1 hypothetical protein TVAG_144420 [Trichomonas vaginalis G3]KAI5546791.1 glycosyltransferase family [Trichomonas vaginalis G3]|eukprot:XP_001308623.1 hypothetical protein [Trichomonas vaginalis G3]